MKLGSLPVRSLGPRIRNLGDICLDIGFDVRGSVCLSVSRDITIGESHRSDWTQITSLTVTQGTHPLRLHSFFPYPASQPKDGAIPRDNEGRVGRIQKFKDRTGRKTRRDRGWIFPAVLCTKGGPMRSTVLWPE